MKREPLLWRMLARVCALPPVTNWLVNRAMMTPYMHIPGSGPDGFYMQRWWLFNPYNRAYVGRWFKGLPSIRVHHIQAPDSDEHLHNHPLRFRTILLRGWYCEQRYGQKETIARFAGDTYSMRPEQDFHRIYAIPAEGVWSLFITWPKREGTEDGEWGFLVDGTVIPVVQYKATIGSRK